MSFYSFLRVRNAFDQSTVDVFKDIWSNGLRNGQPTPKRTLGEGIIRKTIANMCAEYLWGIFLSPPPLLRLCAKCPPNRLRTSLMRTYISQFKFTILTLPFFKLRTITPSQVKFFLLKNGPSSHYSTGGRSKLGTGERKRPISPL